MRDVSQREIVRFLTFSLVEKSAQKYDVNFDEIVEYVQKMVGSNAMLRSIVARLWTILGLQLMATSVLALEFRYEEVGELDVRSGLITDALANASGTFVWAEPSSSVQDCRGPFFQAAQIIYSARRSR